MNCATMGTRGRGLIGLVALTVCGVGPIRAQFPTEPPPPAELKPLAFPPFQEAALDNGLTIILVENHRLPIVSIRLAVRAGSRDDPADRAGLADMVSDLLTKGTEGRSADQIAAEIEGVGASLSAGAGTDFLFLSTTVLTEHTQLAFDLMSDVVLNATFPEEEFSLAQTRMLSGLRVQQADPSAIADRYFFQELYGEHPYARQASAASVEAMTRADVAEWAAAYLRPGSGTGVRSMERLAAGRRIRRAPCRSCIGHLARSPTRFAAGQHPRGQPGASRRTRRVLRCRRRQQARGTWRRLAAVPGVAGTVRVDVRRCLPTRPARGYRVLAGEHTGSN